MQLKNSNTHYGILTIGLHWLSAVVVIGLFVLGWWMVDLSYYDKWYTTSSYWHKGVGVIFAMLLLIRVVWKFINPKPKAIGLSKTFAKLVRVTHYLLYLLLMSIVMTGYLVTTADNRDLDVLGLFVVPASITAFANQETLMGDWHRWLAYGLAGLVVMHVLAALKHHFIDKDATLRRMLGK